MFLPISTETTQNRDSGGGVHWSFVLWVGLSIMPAAAQAPAAQAPAAQAPAAQAPAAQAPAIEQPARPLEPGRPVERELAGGQSHTYQLTLAVGQYAGLVVDQRGIDVTVKLLGPDGKQLAEFDSEFRRQGAEPVSWVAEQAGEYRLNVAAKQKEAAAGRYEIRSLERRAATENDLALAEARKSYAEFVRLLRTGKYDEALKSVERALEIRERILGPEHPEVATALNGLAIIYSERGDYIRTESLYRRALAIWERALGPDYHGNSLALNNLGNIYKERGDFEQAEPLYRRALTIAEQTLPPEHPNVGLFLSNLGNLYRERGEYARAEPLFQRALAVKEKTLGPTHFSVAYTLNDLAFVYSEKGRYAEAEPLYRRALAILEKAAGPEHFSVATVLNNLGTLYRRKGDYAQAEPLYRRALALREKAFGPLHPLMATSYGELARLSAGQGDRARAVASMADANQVSEHNLALNLATGSERQKLAYLSLLSKQTDLTLSIHSLTAPDDPQALHLAFTTLLRRKGRGLDVMTDTVAALRRRAQPEDRALLDQLAQARSQLAALSLKEPGGARPETYRARLKPLEERVEKLESELSAHSAEFRAQAQPVTIETVQAAIPAETILVEFAVYTPQQPATESSQPPHYLAYLLAAQGPPRWVALGETAPIDRAVEDWRQALRDPDRKDVKSLARAVDEQVMRPVRAAIQSGMGIPRRLLIAPDGSLNLIPFAALVDRRKRYLVERYAISYLTSGRDLLRQPAPEPTRNAPLVVANPAFGKVATLAARADQSPENLRTGNPATARVDQTQVFFQPLPGTEEEARAIKSVLPETSLLLREEATEAALKRARAPRILHIATHGFFFNEQRSPEDLPPTAGLRLSKWTAQVENPLLRSGLALAGANQGLSGDDDGVLTALEAAGLDLWGTELVVLSACDTGLGEIKNGEGVQGLRRALVLAGSQSQVMSLWPVPDETTKDLMVPYYRALRQGAGRGDGLRRVQLRMLRSRSQRHPFYWAAFIQSGEWSRLK